MTRRTCLPEEKWPVVLPVLRAWRSRLDEAGKRRLDPLIARARHLVPDFAADTRRRWIGADWFARELAPAWLTACGLTTSAEGLRGSRPTASDDDVVALAPRLAGAHRDAWNSAAVARGAFRRACKERDVAASRLSERIENAPYRLGDDGRATMFRAIDELWHSVLDAALHAPSRYINDRASTREAAKLAAAEVLEASWDIVRAAAENAVATDIVLAGWYAGEDIAGRDAWSRGLEASGGTRPAVGWSWVAEEAAEQAVAAHIRRGDPPAQVWAVACEVARAAVSAQEWRATWEAMRQELGQEVWERVHANERAVASTMARDGRACVSRAAAWMLALDSVGRCQDVVAYRAATDAIASGRNPSEAVRVAIEPTVLALRDSVWNVLDRLVEPN